MMTEFSHSEVLFAGDDGLPLQFNIQNTTGKENLKALIEHGGGMCTFSDEAMILVSPGTKVLNIPASKNLISSRFVFDCVKENCLFDTDEYRIEINETQASDFSDNSSSMQASSLTFENNMKLPDDVVDNSVDLIQSVKTLSNNMASNSNHDFDFLDTENRNTVAEEIHTSNEQQNIHINFPLQSSENHINFGVYMNKNGNLKNCANVIPDSLKISEPLGNEDQSKVANEQLRENAAVAVDEDPARPVVSSSQEVPGILDQFDNMILNKAQEKPKVDEDSLSQSYTVSSSADAQISPNQGQSHHTSAEIFDGSSAAPDSASQTTERQQYINNLEKEVEQILKKPSPISIQDKVALVKYICTVKRLPPATVLQALQNMHNGIVKI